MKYVAVAADVVKRLLNAELNTVRLENGAEISKHRADVKKFFSGDLFMIFLNFTDSKVIAKICRESKYTEAYL